jgi:hypothetical protein|tara:strand:- start:45 stop:1313 length:1269 start_codon:yes stop_codon:yes gene_type:complete
MNIKSNNTFIKDICLTLGHFCKYDQEEFEVNSYVLSESLNSINSDYPIDSYGMLSKNKLLFKEPIILSNLKIHFRNKNLVNKYQEDSKIINIESFDEKKFFSIHLKKINHKYKNLILKTLSLSNSSTIFFPTENSIIIIADSLKELQTYQKVFDKNNSDNVQIEIIKIPTKIKIINSEKNKKILHTNNSSFLSMSVQLSDLIEENLPNSDLYMASDNQISLTTKLIMMSLNFIPIFIATFLLRFLQRHIGSFQFYKQLLGINYLISRDSFKYSDVFEYQNKLNYLVGSKIPDFKFSKNNKEFYLKDLLYSEKNFLTTDQDSNPVFSGNKILISSNGYMINDHAYSLLSLNTHSYILTNSGLVIEVFENNSKVPFLEPKIDKVGYVDDKQLVIDTFDVKNFKSELPKLPKFKAHKLFKFFKKA